MQFNFLDFETYYDQDYSLRKMTPVEYVLDPRFEALGCAFLTDGGRQWVDGPDLPAYFKTVDWTNTFAVSHNALFDMLVLALRYNVHPGVMGDTLAMARNWISHSSGSVSLAACAKYYGLPDKWTTVQKTKGVNFHALKANPALYTETAGYALDDAGKCQHIFCKMLEEGFPPNQLTVVDMAIRMVTQPKLEMDVPLLHEHLAAVQAEKQQLLDEAGLSDRTNLMKDAPFAAMLTFLGVDVPMKASKTTGKEMYAFAKTDKAFTELLEHDNPKVQALVAARLGHKSTIEETRTQRLIDISRFTTAFSVPLKYSGAHTHRFSGDWKINAQNLPRGSRLRKAIKAPKGHVIVSVDASQIEARFNASLSGETQLIEAFREERDVYSEFAQSIYGYEINKVKTPTERFVGKTGILSLGYGSSWPVFQNMCRVQGNVHLTDSEAANIVSLYRQKYSMIVANWDHAGKYVLPLMASDPKVQDAGKFINGDHWSAWGPVTILRNALALPSGNKLRYRDLNYAFDEKFGRYRWTFMRGNMPQSTYGAKVVENVVQALAFVHIMEVAMRVKDMTNGALMPAHQIHDELLYVVPEKLADMVKQIVVAEMAKSPVWMPNAPLAAEGNIGVAYGDTK